MPVRARGFKGGVGVQVVFLLRGVRALGFWGVEVGGLELEVHCGLKPTQVVYVYWV